MVSASRMRSDFSRRPRPTAAQTRSEVCSRQRGMSRTRSGAMSRSCWKASLTSVSVQQDPSRPATASRAVSVSSLSMPVTSSFLTNFACSGSERCSSWTMHSSSWMLFESKYSMIDSLTSVRNCLASPVPQTLRLCCGVSRWAFLTTSTPAAPPKRMRRALFRNSAGSSSCCTAPTSSPTISFETSSVASSTCPILPSSLEKPRCRSTSSRTQSRSESARSRSSRRAKDFRSSRWAFGTHNTPMQAAMTTSWWKHGFPWARSHPARARVSCLTKSSLSSFRLAWSWKSSKSARCWSRTSRTFPSSEEDSVLRRSFGRREKRPLSRRPTLEERRATMRPATSGTSSCRSSQEMTSFSKPRMS
mmetsp:Transcript_3608/g.10461  ORF Transcript_3608/g.10461 Transcript_3608/m.10461 type:complete len:361 (+) Transcript_3608:85-1167(+)